MKRVILIHADWCELCEPVKEWFKVFGARFRSSSFHISDYSIAQIEKNMPAWAFLVKEVPTIVLIHERGAVALNWEQCTEENLRKTLYNLKWLEEGH